MKTKLMKNRYRYRDVTSIWYYGTGDVEFTLGSEAEFEPVKAFIKMAYSKVGNNNFYFDVINIMVLNLKIYLSV